MQVVETFNEEQVQEHTGAGPAAWTRPGTGEQYVNAFGKGASRCYNCQGYGHLARECPSKGKGKGLNQVGEPEVFDQWEPEEWGSPEIRTLSHIQERMLDPELEGASKEGWTLIDFVKKRRRQGEVKKAKKEKAQELRIIRTIEAKTVNSVTTKNKWDVIDLARVGDRDQRGHATQHPHQAGGRQQERSAVRGCQRRAHPEPR